MSGPDLVCAHCGAVVSLGSCPVCRLAQARIEQERWRQFVQWVVVGAVALTAMLALALYAIRDGSSVIYGT